ERVDVAEVERVIARRRDRTGRAARAGAERQPNGLLHRRRELQRRRHGRGVDRIGRGIRQRRRGGECRRERKYVNGSIPHIPLYGTVRVEVMTGESVPDTVVLELLVGRTDTPT